MVNMDEYLITGDYNQMVVVVHANCQEEVGDGYSGPVFNTLTDLLNWIMEHDKTCIRESDMR